MFSALRDEAAACGRLVGPSAAAAVGIGGERVVRCTQTTQVVQIEAVAMMMTTAMAIGVHVQCLQCH